MAARTVSVLVKKQGRVKRKSGKVTNLYVRKKEVIVKRKIGKDMTVSVLVKKGVKGKKKDWRS